MNVHFARAKALLKSAALPDRTVGGFTSAALDGTGKVSVPKSTLRGAGQDAFELVANPFKALVELGRGIRG